GARQPGRPGRVLPARRRQGCCRDAAQRDVQPGGGATGVTDAASGPRRSGPRRSGPSVSGTRAAPGHLSPCASSATVAAGRTPMARPPLPWDTLDLTLPDVVSRNRTPGPWFWLNVLPSTARAAVSDPTTTGMLDWNVLRSTVA